MLLEAVYQVLGLSPSGSKHLRKKDNKGGLKEKKARSRKFWESLR